MSNVCVVRYFVNISLLKGADPFDILIECYQFVERRLLGYVLYIMYMFFVSPNSTVFMREGRGMHMLTLEINHFYRVSN